MVSSVEEGGGGACLLACRIHERQDNIFFQTHSFIICRLINQYHFGDLDPGDYYTVEMWVTSLGDDVTALVRSYTFYDHTYPIEPTISTAVTVAEHTMHFGWTNPVYFEVF